MKLNAQRSHSLHLQSQKEEVKKKPCYVQVRFDNMFALMDGTARTIYKERFSQRDVMETQSPGLVMHDVSMDTEYEVESGSWICFPPESKMNFFSTCGEDSAKGGRDEVSMWLENDKAIRRSHSMMHTDLR